MKANIERNRRVIEYIHLGYGNKKIMSLTGISQSYLNQIRRNIGKYEQGIAEAEDKGSGEKELEYEPDWELEWNDAVNKIRKYLGKKPL
ncbi:MAG TPA: hypothetical protein IAA00_02265 [Candidatus Blautia ornithocaccae]|nr:hypothetical protein [Candidatus Blautia ornithocaccae]